MRFSPRLQGCFTFLELDIERLLREVREEWFPELAGWEIPVGFVSGVRPLACIRVPRDDQPPVAPIRLNRALDRADLPEEVLAYVLKHELLHIEFGRFGDPHPPEFWEEEAVLAPEADRCWRWIWANIGHRLVHRPRGVWVSRRPRHPCPVRHLNEDWQPWPPTRPAAAAFVAPAAAR